MIRLPIAICVLLVGMVLGGGEEKIVVTSIEQLPQHSYEIEGTLADLMASEVWCLEMPRVCSVFFPSGRLRMFSLLRLIAENSFPQKTEVAYI